MHDPAADTLAPLSATIAPLGLEAKEAIDAVASMGYRAVQWSATQPGMRPRDLDASMRRGVAAHLRRLGLSCSGVDLFIPGAHFVEPAHIDRAIDAVAQASSLAVALGRCAVHLALPEPDASAPGRCDEAVRAICEIADREHLLVVDYSVGALEASARDQGSPLRVGIDPAVLIAAGRDVPLAVGRAGVRLGGARVCDLLQGATRAPVGEAIDGRLDLAAYRAALTVVGLRTSPVADARQWSNPGGGLLRTLDRWQQGVIA